MTIRPADFTDIPQLIDFARRYFEAEGRKPNLDALANFYMAHLTNGNAICFVNTERNDPGKVNSFICGEVCNHPLHGERVAFLTKWYAEPGAGGHGAHLFNAFEKWAKSRDVLRVYVTARVPRTFAFLDKKGYHFTEAAFSKVLA